MATRSPNTARPKIVIVGGGFGGMAAIHALQGVAVDITLVDRTNHFLFQPLLYQVAAAALSPADIATASRSMLRSFPNVTVWMANVTGIETGPRVVQLADNPDLPYDYLILATGARYSFFGHDEWAPYVHVLKSLQDALAIRERILGAFEKAEACGDPALVARLLTFVVVGAGPTGVELAGTIAELARSTLARDFKHIEPQSARIILCETGNRVLANFPQRLSAYAAKALQSLRVELRLGEPVTEIDRDGLRIGETAIATDCILWCAGTAANPAAAWLTAERAKNGAIKVASDCSIPGHPEIFALGDVASFRTESGRALPGLAPVAKQQGAYVGKLLKRRMAGEHNSGPFKFRDYGTMAVIGRSRAVADFGRFTLTGFPAWLAWSTLHLMLLIDFRSRILVFVNWSWAWFTYGRGARLLIGQAPLKNLTEFPDEDKATTSPIAVKHP
jgi:NADH dehydrogenase